MIHFTSPLALFVALVIGHVVCDYPLQGDFLAKAKNHRAPIAGVPWYQALSAHSLIHAGMVWLLTGSLMLGTFEYFAHMAIDHSKCEGLIAFDTDQALHVVCKAAWMAMLYGGGT